MATPANRARLTAPARTPASALVPVPRPTSPVPARTPSPPRLAPPTSTLGISTSRVVAAVGPGEPLSDQVRPLLQRGFGTPLDDVRVHQGDAAARLARAAGVRAFAAGPHVVLGAGESPADIELLAHEIAHVVQQGTGGVMRGFTRSPGGDSFEREAAHAATVVSGGGTVAIAPRAGAPAMQGLGVSDALDFFAEHANMIPGFRLFTIVLGVNPINMTRVERSAANILRAVVEFIPGGALIRTALDSFGIFDRVGAWVEEQISALGMTGAVIRQALDRFIDSLSFSDIFDLGGVWERARRIFAEPIERLLSTARSFAAGAIRFIKDAILLPLARLAQGTRGYDLLKAVLGRDPISGEPVPQNAETLIGGFMHLIGQDEVWQNLQQSRAIPRAWTWFQGALQGLLGFVGQIPALVTRAFQALELVDIVVVPRAFSKLVDVFGGFVERFFTWAGGQVLSLLQIIFEVVAPGVIPYINKAAAAFRRIINDPVRFIGYLVRAGIDGFRKFAANFLTYLQASLLAWLTGTLGSGVYIPQGFSLMEIVKFVLSVLGLTWQNIRQKLVARVGETVVAVLERTFDIVVTLVRDGPAAAWEKIVESLTNLRDMAIEAIKNFVLTRIVTAAITRLVSSLNPVGAFVQAVIGIYNTIMFIVERLRQIGQVVARFIDSVDRISRGDTDAASTSVADTMGGLLTLVISFLARLIGLGNVSEAVQGLIARIRAPIDRALDRVVGWIVDQARRLGRAIVSGARSLVEWWRARKPFSTPSGERHTLFFQGSGASARLTLASDDPRPYRDVINATTGSGKAAALRIADQLDAALRAAGAGGAVAANAPAEIERLLDRLATATAGLLPAGGGTSSPTIFGSLTAGFGSSARVARLTNNNPGGGQPTVASGLWEALRRRQDRGGSYYVRGHLLNHNLGGAGNTWSNLTPLTQNANNRAEDSMLHEFETPVKTAVAALAGNAAVNFEVTARYGRSHPLAGQIQALRASPSDDDHVIADIIAAERSVPTAVVCKSFRIDPTGRVGARVVDEKIISNTIGDSAVSEYQLTPTPKRPLVINDVPQTTLTELDGIDPAMAKRIFDNRPYRTSQQLKSEAQISDAQWERARATPRFYVRLYRIG